MTLVRLPTIFEKKEEKEREKKDRKNEQSMASHCSRYKRAPRIYSRARSCDVCTSDLRRTDVSDLHDFARNTGGQREGEGDV